MWQIESGAVRCSDPQRKLSAAWEGSGVFPRTDQVKSTGRKKLKRKLHDHWRGPLPYSSVRWLSDVASMYICLVDETRDRDLG